MKINIAFCFFLMLVLGYSRAVAQDNQLSAAEKKQGWVLLFDGTKADQWKGAFIPTFPSKGWKIGNGCLVVESSNGQESTNGGDIVTRKTYRDFELSVDFKLTTGANSGIKYFVDNQQAVPADPRSAIGLEYQLLDDDVHPDAKLGHNGNRKLASLYDLIPAPERKPLHPVGEWNTAKIISSGNHVEHWLNGVKIIEYERGSPAFNSLVANSKYRTIAGFGLGAKGSILLQDHGNRVFFKNIKIRELGKTHVTLTQEMNPGLVSYTFRDRFQKDVAGTLDMIRKMGIVNIEFSNLFGKTAEDLRRLLDERGMICTSFGVSYPDLIGKTAEVAVNAQTLGAKFVRVAWIPHESKSGFTIDDAKKAADEMNKAGKMLAEKYSLTLCYHNHGYEFAPYQQGTYYDYLLAETDPRYVRLELDILWAFHPGADPVQLIKKYGARISLMHVKDLRKGIKGDFSGSTPVENDVTLGTGQINLPDVIEAARAAGVKYYYIEDESNNSADQVPLSLNYLKALLAKK